MQGAGLLLSSMQVRSRERREGDGEARVMARREVRMRMVSAGCILDIREGVGMRRLAVASCWSEG